MKCFTRVCTLIILLLFSAPIVRACACEGHCSFLGHVDTAFMAYRYLPHSMDEDVVIVKAVVLDSIPNSYNGSRVKLLQQYYGRPVKDTFNFLPIGTDCDLYLRHFHKRGEDTLFLFLHRQVTNRFGDTVAYSMSMCGKAYAVVKNDSVYEWCRGTASASAYATLLTTVVKTLGVTETAVGARLRAYPNPAMDLLTIGGAEGCTAVLTNSIGQQIVSTRTVRANEQLSISAIPSGIYTLAVQDAAGERALLRIVKQ